MDGKSLADLRRLAGEATPGPWREWIAEGTFLEIQTVEDRYPILGTSVHGGLACSRANSAFIAAANPATVLALLDEIERLRQTIDNLSDGKRQPVNTANGEWRCLCPTMFDEAFDRSVNPRFVKQCCTCGAKRDEVRE